MKKTNRRILSVVLAIITLISMATIAGAKTAKPISYIEGIPVKAKYDLNVGDFMGIEKPGNVDSVSAWYMGDNNYSVDVIYDEDNEAVEFFAQEEGVALMEVCGYKAVPAFDEEFGEEYTDYELVDDYFVIIAVHPRKGAYDLGKVESIYMDDVKVNYKDNYYIFPEVYTKDDDYASFCTYFVGNSYNAVDVYEDGEIYAYHRGTDNCTCYVIDAQGNIFSSEFSITVKYSFVQWLIRIFLFGFIWY